MTDRTRAPADQMQTRAFADQDRWTAWLEKHHADSPGIWLRLAKAASGIKSVTYAEAVETALCYGWIDGQSKGVDDSWWVQRFVPRRPKSTWSKNNRERVARLIKQGRMRPPGLAAIESAKEDGRWDAAYDPPSKASVPPDLQAAFRQHRGAEAFFSTLDSRNRYAVLFRIQKARKPETRARLIEKLAGMLERREKLYP